MENQRARSAFERACDQPRAAAAVLDAEVESPSQIRQALSYGDHVAEQLHKEITAVERRLECGLTPEGPSAGAGTSASSPGPVESPMLHGIHCQNRTLSHAIERLADIRRRVEL